MSLIATITAPANAKGHKIEYATRALDIQVKVTEPDNYANAAAFIAAIDEIEIEVNKQTKGGTQKILQRGNLLDYMEIAQGNGGLIELNASALGAPYIRGRVELSDFGAIPLGNDEFFEVNFIDVTPTGDGDETLEILVNAIDHGDLTSTHNVYDRHHFNEGAPREIDVRNAKLIAIQAADTDEVELLYPNGRRVLYVKEELIALQTDWLMVRNLTHLAAATQVNNLNRTILVNVANATVAKITTANDSKVLVLKYAKL